MKFFYLNSFPLLDSVTHHSSLHHYFVWYIAALLSLTKQKKSKKQKKQQICHILEAELKETFQKQAGSFNYSRSFKIKSIILLCSEVINVCLLSAHEKGTFGFSVKGQRFKNILIDALRLFDASPEKNISCTIDGAHTVTGETNCSAGKREVWVRKVYPRHFFLWYFIFSFTSYLKN